MRTRPLVVLALLTLPAALAAQVIPRTGTSRRPPTGAQPLPPKEAEPVARALAYRRSRWTFQGYGMLSNISAPVPGGGSSSFTAYGAGAHADYRLNDRFSTTVDATASNPGDPSTVETIETGARFSPTPWDEVRPFVDARAGFMRMYDTFDLPGQDPSLAFSNRYSRGFGGVAGAGLEFPLRGSLSMTTEFSAMRNRLRTYRISPGSAPTGDSFWMKTYRFSMGLSYNRSHLFSQNPRQ